MLIGFKGNKAPEIFSNIFVESILTEVPTEHESLLA